VRGLTPLPWGFASRTRLTSGHTRPGIRGSDQEYRIASSRSPSATVIAIHRAMLPYTARNASTRSVSSAAAASS
jgi:hypothetical protein